MWTMTRKWQGYIGHWKKRSNYEVLQDVLFKFPTKMQTNHLRDFIYAPILTISKPNHTFSRMHNCLSHFTTQKNRQITRTLRLILPYFNEILLDRINEAFTFWKHRRKFDFVRVLKQGRNKQCLKCCLLPNSGPSLIYKILLQIGIMVHHDIDMSHFSVS